jgi:hypothetical protein
MTNDGIIKIPSTLSGNTFSSVIFIGQFWPFTILIFIEIDVLVIPVNILEFGMIMKSQSK